MDISQQTDDNFRPKNLTDEQWWQQIKEDCFSDPLMPSSSSLSNQQSKVGPKKYLTIERFQRELNCKALTAIIQSCCNVLPVRITTCFKQDDIDTRNPIALVEFKTIVDALTAIDKLRQAAVAKNWRLKLIAGLQFASENA